MIEFMNTRGAMEAIGDRQVRGIDTEGLKVEPYDVCHRYDYSKRGPICYAALLPEEIAPGRSVTRYVYFVESPVYPLQFIELAKRTENRVEWVTPRIAFGTPAPPSLPSQTPTPTSPTPAPGTGQLIAMGPLEGADSFHTASGRVLLVRAPDGRVILRFEDYAVRNGPDLYVYLTPDPGGDVRADGAIEVSAVRATRGSVNYDVPDGADPSAFRAAVIYSRPLAVTYATAQLE